MGRLLNIVTPLHTADQARLHGAHERRQGRLLLKAKEYEADYWDGDRRFGYGGYRFIEGRWTPVAKALIDTYGLKDGSSVLDVGCGKGFLLYEMKKILPGLKIAGFDISRHGLADAHEQVTTLSVQLPRAGRLSVWRQPFRSGDLARHAAQFPSFRTRNRRRRNRARRQETNTSWSKAIGTSREMYNLRMLGFDRRIHSRTPPNGSGCITSSAIPATTNSSTSNKRCPARWMLKPPRRDPRRSRASR